jgi:hypothetical protein
MIRGLALAAVAAVGATGCSFFLVKGPAERVDILPGARVECTESGVVPLVDTFGGLVAITTSGVGILLEQTSDNGEPENFTRYYAGPLAAVAIAYFIAASRGNTRVTWCSDVNERLRSPGERVIPVNPDRKQQDDKEDPL